MQTIHIYIDESGQDTEGEMFIVSVVVALGDPGELGQQIVQMEQATHKRRKWHKSTDAINLAFIRRANSDLTGLVVAYVENGPPPIQWSVLSKGCIASRAIRNFAAITRCYLVVSSGKSGRMGSCTIDDNALHFGHDWSTT